jgi:NAD kinase
MTRSIAIFGSSFNPPGTHHRRIASQLVEQFDEVVVVPCGPRPDKPVTNDVPPTYRAAMTDMTFAGIDRVRVELFDLEAASFTRTHQLAQRFGGQGEIWHVVDARLVVGGGQGRSKIQSSWERGPELWRTSRFVVVRAEDGDLDPADLPPQHRLLTLPIPKEARQIRQMVFNRAELSGLVLPQVAAYIERHGLYRGSHPIRSTRYPLSELRPLVVVDPRNDLATELAAHLDQGEVQDPNLIVVIGGDGTMLRTIRQMWRLRVPFYGINAGHMGFLLNATAPDHYLGQELVLESLPLLHVETEGPQDSQPHASLAFNDAWVERATGQTAWLRVTVDGLQRLPQLVSDGALISTAAGSTSYARAMGASPMPMNTPALLLVGSNVLKPPFWRPVVLPLDATLEITTLDPVKRPLQGYIDGVSQGEVHCLRARASRVATVELAFDPTHNPADKLARIQFPLPEE